MRLTLNPESVGCLMGGRSICGWFRPRHCATSYTLNPLCCAEGVITDFRLNGASEEERACPLREDITGLNADRGMHGKLVHDILYRLDDDVSVAPSLLKDIALSSVHTLKPTI